MKNIINEIRIVVCGLLFSAISRIAPIGTVEGELTIDTCLEWSDKMELAFKKARIRKALNDAKKRKEKSV